MTIISCLTSLNINITTIAVASTTRCIATIDVYITSIAVLSIIGITATNIYFSSVCIWAIASIASVDVDVSAFAISISVTTFYENIATISIISDSFSFRRINRLWISITTFDGNV